MVGRPGRALVRRLRAGALTRMRGRRRADAQKAKTTKNAPAFRLPVVLISFNRGPMLRKVVDGYRRQTVAVDLFVHDNGSDDPETIATLDALELEGVVVFRRPKISSAEDLNLVDESVQAVFSDREPSPYAVSDCDVSIAESSPTTLQTYLDLLAAMPDIECAGPMLRIDDVPTTYPLFNAVMNRHIIQFWSHEPQWTTVRGSRVAYQRALIDTTLAVYRKGAPYRRLRKGVRLYHPYDARHLDWYPEEHQSAYRASADGSTISNWSNPARERAHRYTPLEHTQYRAVVEDENGSLVAVTRTVAGAEGVEADQLDTLVQAVRAELAPVWGDALGRVWVWRQTVGVLEVSVGPAEQLGFDLLRAADGGWTALAVARTDEMDRRLKAAGLQAASTRKYVVGAFEPAVGASPEPGVVAAAYGDVLDRVVSTVGTDAGD